MTSRFTSRAATAQDRASWRPEWMGMCSSGIAGCLNGKPRFRSATSGSRRTRAEVMRTGIPRYVNGLEEQPLRPCASAGEAKVPTTGCYVAGIPSP